MSVSRPEPIPLTTDIAAVTGVGPQRARAFRRLGIRCVADLLRHFPLRYEHELGQQSIEDAGEGTGAEHRAEANVTIHGEVLSTRMARGRRTRFEATLTDGTGTVMLTWFNAAWLRDKIHPGMFIEVTGRTKRYGDALQIVNPRWAASSVEAPVGGTGERYRPVYPASESLTSRVISNAVEQVLDRAVSGLEDHLHDEYRLSRELPTLADAYRWIHRPESPERLEDAQRRLAFDELLLLQLAVMIKRMHRHQVLRAPALRHDAAIDEHIRARLPFELTSSQREVIDEIAVDLTRDVPMNRLVQGDVGAGKTVVALYAMLMAVASGHQAILMAPTELLAEQHFGAISGMLDGSNVTLELLTGSLTGAVRGEIKERIESGSVDLVIGTHALLSGDVRLPSPAVAVIDEQHRFGVHQRATLRAKGAPEDDVTTPHMLVMTATPIPRTMSLTIFGDLDISTIKGLPPGRQPITTRWVAPAQAHTVYDYLAQRLRAGEQAYIVVPAVDESATGLADVNSHLESLAAGALSGLRLAAMHGRLKRDERDAIMRRFRNGEIDALVATTVIEVGVDVPNATMMVIEHADRFGLAQLHQLRGRVGRGEHKSLCALIAEPSTEDGTARLEAIVGTTDGFAIAERDLEIRGPGELFGARQSGLAPFRVAVLPRDTELLRMARRDASEWVDADPMLTNPRDALLRRRLLKAHGAALPLGDVG